MAIPPTAADCIVAICIDVCTAAVCMDVCTAAVCMDVCTAAVCNSAAARHTICAVVGGGVCAVVVVVWADCRGPRQLE